MITKKKLIEVALPLDAINEACAREKSIRHGHPSTLHLWWARRPLAAARAVIFAQMVDDPSSNPDLFPTLKAQEKERKRLFKIIEDLVLWENTTNEEVLNKAREEIWASWKRACAENADHPRAKELFDRNKLPAFHDPFAGGGALPLEAQRLGLEAYASDLNPVAVLINKAMIEIPPKFAGMPPVNPEARKDKNLFEREWKGAEGLAEDVRYYGKWMRDEAEKRIGHLYPKVEITKDMVKERTDLKPYLGRQLTVIAWLWARTVKSPNPAFRHIDVPLASTFMLSTKAGKEAYVQPVIEKDGYRFTVKVGKPKDAEAAKSGTKLARGANFKCLMSDTPMEGDYIKAEGKAGRMGARMMAIVAEGDRGRVYLAPTPEHEKIAAKAKPGWELETPLPDDARNFWTVNYGLVTYGALFTCRQTTILLQLTSLIHEIIKRSCADAVSAGLDSSMKPLRECNTTAMAYAEAVAAYMALATSKIADRGSNICGWDSSRDSLRNTFGRQAIPMTWDYAESNALSSSSGSFVNAIDQIEKVMKGCFSSDLIGSAVQLDATTQCLSYEKIVSTDPPYYDNIDYADLSDFFYVWLRLSLKAIFPELFGTLTTPKAEELIASPYRQGGKEKAETFFLKGMTNALSKLVLQSHQAFPITIYYAFKQAEHSDDSGISRTGWETFLEAVIKSGFSISGTLPMRTELLNKLVGINANMLASSIVLVCRKRDPNAPTATRREFLIKLKADLPEALAHLQRGNIAPVDLAQAAIGPGMAIFTSYSKVLDAEGKALSVREALAIINQVLEETLTEQEGDFDADTRFALAWFQQYGFEEGEFGVAETLSKAKNTSVQGLVDAGILKSGKGKVNILKPSELSTDWDPETDARLTTWEIVHHLIRRLEKDGDQGAAEIVARLGSKAETARELCYRLYLMCEHKKRNAEALPIMDLVQTWTGIMALAHEIRKTIPKQGGLFENGEE